MNYLFGTELELKTSSSKEGNFEGYAAIFDKKDRGMDIILPGAFTKTLKARSPKKVKMFRQHDSRVMIGAWDKFSTDKKGLFAKGHLLLDLPPAKEAHVLMKEGLLDSLSIGFISTVTSWDSNKNARLLHEVDLLEVSAVAIPMQEGAIITAVKSIDPDSLTTKTDLERALRNAGFSKSTAKYICSGWMPPARRNDEGGKYTTLLGKIHSLAASMKPI